MVRVFIGYDPAETVAYHVLAHSILRHASVPVSITGLVLRQLPMTRERDPKQSTEFSFSRFLVPWLCGFKGTAIFMDCDMLVRADVAELHCQRGKSVSVVKHDYTPSTEGKFLGNTQTRYAKKNWSSVMVFDCGGCAVLTPEYVNTASGLDLHQFKWLGGDYLIGKIAPEWNHLVGEYPPNGAAKLVHYTLGTPCFAKYANCEYAEEWHEERRLMLAYKREGEFSKPEKDAA